jgi:DNA (cytosine-5)-methyltransferase 1
MTIKILDLFAGVGGLSLGFEMVKDRSGKRVFELYRAVEIDKYACQTLRRRHREEKVIEGDLTKLKISKKIIDECKDNVSVVVGGIPCQSFSLIGPRSGFGKKIEKFRNDKRDNLYEHFRDIVDEIKPNIIVIENVKGILSKKNSKGNKIINKLICDFEKLGYNFENAKGEKWHLLNAADFGVPQKRERVILVGVKKLWKKILVPNIKPTHFDPSSENAEELLANGLKPYVSLYEAIGDLPKVKPKITFTGLREKEREIIRMKNKAIRSGKDKIEIDKRRFRKYLHKISQSGTEFFNFVRPNGYKYIDHHTARSQQISDIELFRLMRQGETAKDFMERMPDKSRRLIKYTMLSFKDKYRKQCWGQPSTTVFAHLEKDGNRFIHPKQARTYTPREAARIQSFPDKIIFEGSLSKKFKQIGNAVPPLLAFNIGKTVYKILEK